MGQFWLKIADFWRIFWTRTRTPQTRVRVRELDPGTRVSDPGLDALLWV